MTVGPGAGGGGGGVPPPLPELREAEAPPEVAAVYAALRAATGVPLVNLIWRHLATLPGVLPWAWATVRPALEDGRLARARDRLPAAIPLPPLRPVGAEAWRAAGLAAEARAPVLAVIEAYDRGNRTNLVLLTALLDAVEGRDAPAPCDDPPPPAGADVPGLPTLPPLPRLSDLPEATAALVHALAGRHGTAEARGGVVPSLYLHLAHWPALLAALPGWLGPLLEPPALAATRDASVAAARREAAALGLAADPAGVPPDQVAAVRAALGRFTGQVIPGMVPLGLALRRILATA